MAVSEFVPFPSAVHASNGNGAATRPAPPQQLGDLAQELRTFVAQFRQAVDTRTREETALAAYVEQRTAQIASTHGEQLHAATSQRQQAIATATAEHAREQSTAQDELKRITDLSAQQVKQADDALRDAHYDLASVELESLLQEIKPPPRGGDTTGQNAEHALGASATTAVATRGQIRDAVRAFRATQARKRKLTIWAVVIFVAVAVVVAAIVGTQLAQAQKRAEDRRQSEQHYQAAVAALNAGQWDTVRSEVNRIPLAGYKDTQTLVAESYYRPAAAAFGRQDWKTAEENARQALHTIPAYKDSLGILVRSMFNRTETVTFAANAYTAQAQNVGISLTALTITSVQVLADGRLGVDASIFANRSRDSYVVAPDNVSIRVGTSNIPLSSAAGVFAKAQQDNVPLSSSGSKLDGVLWFSGVENVIVNSGCFDLQYGNIYLFNHVCIVN